MTPARISASRLVAHACAWAFVGKVAQSLTPCLRIKTRYRTPLLYFRATIEATGINSGISLSTK